MRELGPALRLLGIGWLVVIAILAGLLGGLWLDQRVLTGFPVFALLGVILGVITAFVGVRRLVRSATEE